MRKLSTWVLILMLVVAMAFGAVANGGYLMKPRIIKEWQDSSGMVLEKNEPYKVRRMVSESVAAKLREMLRGVVSSGTALSVNSKILPGIEFSGKTGTAEYSSDKDKSHSWFMGFTNVENPDLAISVVVEEADKTGVSAVSIAKRVLDAYY